MYIDSLATIMTIKLNTYHTTSQQLVAEVNQFPTAVLDQLTQLNYEQEIAIKREFMFLEWIVKQ